MKNLSMAFAMALASLAYATTAQTAVKTASTNAVYVGKKCPSCDVPTLIKWEYEIDGFVETLTSPDVNSFLKIDWMNMTATTNDSTYKITKYKVSADAAIVTICYGGQTLTKYHNQFGQYFCHTVADDEVLTK